MNTRFAAAFPAETAALRTAYDDNGHAYHAWSHIRALLVDFERLLPEFTDPFGVEAALYFHDVVYVPGATDNETQSAQRLTTEMAGKLPDRVLGHAHSIILATAKHRVPETADANLANDCALFLDMDLAILGAAEDIFDRYDAAIRSEYRAIPDDVYLPRRRAVMEGFLQREHLYLTPQFQTSHDAQARKNLTRLVERLPSA